MLHMSEQFEYYVEGRKVRQIYELSEADKWAEQAFNVVMTKLFKASGLPDDMKWYPEFTREERLLILEAMVDLGEKMVAKKVI